MFHLVANAIKFNKDNGSVKILLSFHTFEDEFKVEEPRNDQAVGLLQCDNLLIKNQDYQSARPCDTSRVFDTSRGTLLISKMMKSG